MKLKEIPTTYLGEVNDIPIWRLERDVHVRDPRKNIDIFVKKGFKFDGASIPKILWSLLAPFELGTLSVVIHDAIYETKGGSIESPFVVYRRNDFPFEKPALYHRKEADLLFYDLMEKDDIILYRRTVAYFAVRWFGRWFSSWRDSP